MLKFSEQLLKVAVGEPGSIVIVKGMPGGGKTLRTLAALDGVAPRSKLVYATPTRSLRDYWAKRFEMEVVRGRQDLCPRASMIKTCSVADYITAVGEVCSTCEDGACPLGEELRSFFSSRHGWYAMTHEMLLIAFAMSPRSFRDAVVVIDEADAFIQLWRFLMTYEEAQRLLQSSNRAVRTLARRVLRLAWPLTVPSRGASTIWGYWVKPLLPRGRSTVLIGATLTPGMLSLLLPEEEDFLSDSMVVHMTVPSPVNDHYIISNDRLYWGSYTGGLKAEEWVDALVETIITAYDSISRRIGVASRSYKLTEMLSARLEERGVRALTDLNAPTPPSRREDYMGVIIWTIGGRWTWGVSMSERDIVICTYQVANYRWRHLHPNIIRVATDSLDDAEDTLTTFINAINAQSYYRGNRQRERAHLVVMADLRAETAVRESLSYHSLLASLARNSKRCSLREVTALLKNVQLPV